MAELLLTAVQAWVRFLYAIVLLPILAGMAAVATIGYLLWGTTRTYDASQQLLAEAFDQGVTEQPVARLVIPTIDLDAYVMAGISNDALTDGPGKYPGTTQPGHFGNMAIAGRRATYGGPFSRIDELTIGDEILVETVDRAFTYRVGDTRRNRGSASLTVGPETSELLSDNGGAQLTLVALHPRFSSQQRLVVFAELLGQPLAAQGLGVPSDTVIGLGAEPYDWPAIIPGLVLAVAGWVGLWLMGRPRRSIVPYEIGALLMTIGGLAWAISAAAVSLPPF